MDGKNLKSKKPTTDFASSSKSDAKTQRKNIPSAKEHDETMEHCGESSSSIDTKLCNAAKLRQQFVDEIKEIELFMKVSREKIIFFTVITYRALVY